ncbi:MAG: hypothetical protein JRH20_25010 [Deltaproteobacteria bacterium]|nr:hypothetical protein [Deltaproteobacteria bacterium]
MVAHAGSDPAPKPEADIAKVRALFQLDIPDDVSNAQKLAPWVEDALVNVEHSTHERRRKQALAQALEAAPPGVKRSEPSPKVSAG